MNDAATDPQRDYRDTVFLPRTSFPMRGDLPAKEPRILAKWDAMHLWGKIRAQSAGRPLFILHDGPPYANGNIHLGTALNKIHKDMINRTRQMAGYDANYIPGWDCHGLPIEWKIEEDYRRKNKDKDMVPILDFRAECRAYADHWLGVQAQEFRRLGVEGDLARPLRHHGRAVRGGDRGRNLQVPAERRAVSRPAPGDVVAGREDRAGRGRDRVSRPHLHHDLGALPGRSNRRCRRWTGAAVVIWTTTPWTMPGNRAVACRAEIRLRASCGSMRWREGSLARAGEKIVIAKALLARC